MIRSYPRNGPEALARVLAMTMITDAAVDDSEIELFERLRIFGMIGISRAGFAQVLQDYCRDIDATAGGRLAASHDVVEAVIADVKDPEKRLLACAMMLSVCYADGRLDESELALMRYVLRRWNLTIESLQALDVAPPRRSPGERPRARHLRRERRWGEDVGMRRRRSETLVE